MQLFELNVIAKTPELHDALLAGGSARRMWKFVLKDTWDVIRKTVPAGSQVLEVGYGDGLLSCYLCHHLGWNLVGLESNSRAYHTAQQNAERFGLSPRAKFKFCALEETTQHRG